MAKVIHVDEGAAKGYLFDCPGCLQSHIFYTERSNAGPAWGFNQNLEKPTFNPSLICHWGNESGPQVCHFFVTGGNIQFLSDCTHAMAGKTTQLPEMPT